MTRSLTSVRTRAKPLLARVLRDRSGAAAVILALAVSAIVGFAGLGTEVAAWYYTKRAMQGAADAAASSAAATLAANTSATSTQMQDVGKSVAATMHFTDGTANTTVSINNPPATTTSLNTCSSPFSAFNCYVEVVINQPQTPLLSALFLSNGPTITARAVRWRISGRPTKVASLRLIATAMSA
jgi:Flp pilus assembly protein TadG